MLSPENTISSLGMTQFARNDNPNQQFNSGATFSRINMLPTGSSKIGLIPIFQTDVMHDVK